MSRGYIRLYRKIRENPVLHERDKRFSKFEAWIDLLLSARGTDDPETGLKRGQLEASRLTLARAWNWGLGSVNRFIAELTANSMLARVDRSPDRSPKRCADR